MTGGKEEIDNRKKAKRNKEWSGETRDNTCNEVSGV